MQIFDAILASRQGESKKIARFVRRLHRELLVKCANLPAQESETS